MTKRRITIKDIAQMAQVSDSTVSRVLNNNPDVNPKTRRKILNIMKSIDFHPSLFARGLVTGKSQVLGFVTENILNPFFADICRGLEDYSRLVGMSVVVLSTDGDAEKEVESINILKGFAAGVVFTSVSVPKELLEKLNDAMPVVLVNRYYENIDIDVVAIDNYRGGYMATSHLLGLGHEKIVVVETPPISSAVAQRTKGYLQALRDKGVTPDERHIINSEHRTYEAGRNCMSRLLDSGIDFTAVLAGNDLMAIGSLDCLIEKGIGVPESISVMGFDDIEAAQYKRISLSTIHQPTYKIGQTAGELLIKRLMAGKSEASKILYEPSLVERGTTALNTSLH